MTTKPQLLAHLNRLVGSWLTEATHPALPGVVVQGSASIEWLEGERFLMQRSRTEHPDFPDAISIIGFTDQDRADGDQAHDPAAAEVPRASLHYFDSRGVFRVYEVDIDERAWRISRRAPGLSQQFTGTFAEGGDIITGLWRMCEDDVHWQDDLQIIYRRRR